MATTNLSSLVSVAAKKSQAMGGLEAPIAVTHAFSKKCNFDDPATEVLSWVFQDESGELFQANTYNGQLRGKNKPQPYKGDAKAADGYVAKDHGAELPAFLAWGAAPVTGEVTEESETAQSE